MTTLTLHPINEGFDNDTGMPMAVYSFTPDHLPWLLRGEYRFLRKEGTSRRAARWHIHRVIAMIANAAPMGWKVEMPGDDDDLIFAEIVDGDAMENETEDEDDS